MNPYYQKSLDNTILLDEPFIDPDFHIKPMVDEDEFFDMMAKDLGKLYGLNDIREAV